MQFDITIIGGGMVGAALACALRSMPLQIALIDSAALDAKEDHRLIALNDSSCCLLKNLDVWPKLTGHAAAIKEVHVSYRGYFGTTCIHAKEQGVEALGHVIPAKYINAALYETLKQADNITLLQPAHLENLIQHEDHVEMDILLHDEKKFLKSQLVIGADGSFSTVRKLLNIPTEIIDYQQSALVTTTELQRSHHHVAYERFHQDGAIAMLPLPGHRVATILTDSNENIQRYMQLDDSEFLQHLQKQFGYRLGRLKSISQRYTYPLKKIQATVQVKHRTLLIGNAAHTLHPIAAQGLNLALHEVATIAEKINPTNLSTDNLLTELTQQNSSIRLSHYLPWVFTSDFFLVAKARQLGLIGLDLCSLLKKRFGQHAMGRAGSVPELMRLDCCHSERPLSS